jgi:hypothetical protein
MDVRLKEQPPLERAFPQPLILMTRPCAGDIEVTAIHSHMLDEEPRMFFIHFWANDDGQRACAPRWVRPTSRSADGPQSTGKNHLAFPLQCVSPQPGGRTHAACRRL